MIKRRCMSCGGSGRIMGGGMLMQDCENCNGTGKILEIADEMGYLELKETERYKEAIESMEKKGIPKEQAKTLLDKEIKEKIENDKKERKGK